MDDHNIELPKLKGEDLETKGSISYIPPIKPVLTEEQEELPVFVSEQNNENIFPELNENNNQVVTPFLEKDLPPVIPYNDNENPIDLNAEIKKLKAFLDEKSNQITTSKITPALEETKIDLQNEIAKLKEFLNEKSEQITPTGEKENHIDLKKEIEKLKEFLNDKTSEVISPGIKTSNEENNIDLKVEIEKLKEFLNEKTNQVSEIENAKEDNGVDLKAEIEDLKTFLTPKAEEKENEVSSASTSDEKKGDNIVLTGEEEVKMASNLAKVIGTIVFLVVVALIFYLVAKKHFVL